MAAFELVVERETGSTYHLKNQLQKKKKQNTMIETQKVMRRIRSVRLAVKTLGLQMTLQDVTHAISGSPSIVLTKVLIIFFDASIVSKNITVLKKINNIFVYTTDDI